MLLLAPSARGRGLYLEEPPWYGPALADTTLSIAFGAMLARGDTTATVVRAALSPFRRGPLRLGATWSWVSVRTAAGRAFGFGDPKVYARLRLAGHDSAFAALHVEGAARLPTAQAKLFPFASGGQELELLGSLGLGRGRPLRLGAGYIWSEPPTGSTLGVADVPHALHAWGCGVRRAGGWALRLRADALWMQGGHERAALEGSLTRLATTALRTTLAAGLEFGTASDRALDSWLGFLVAMPLR